MIRLAFTVLAALVGTASRADDVLPLKALEGTYTATSLAKGGKPAPEDVSSGMKLKIDGDVLTFTIGGKSHPAKATKVDAKAMPAAIDLAPTDGPEKGKTFLGIYSFKDGELTLAFTEKGDRPKDFTGANDATVVKLKKMDR